MDPREYGFNERLHMSHGHIAHANVREVLMYCIPGAIDVEKADVKDDKTGVDYWVHRKSAKSLAVDVKVRSKDYSVESTPQDDLALETWSVVEREIVGWTRDESKQCDFVLWTWKDTGRFCLLPFPLLCLVFRDLWRQWMSLYRCAKQCTSDRAIRYTSEVVFVPRKVVMRAIYDRTGGATIHERLKDLPKDI